MLSVASKLYMLSVVMLSVVMLYVVVPSHHIIIIKKATFSITTLSIMGDFFMLSVIYAVCLYTKRCKETLNAECAYAERANAECHCA